MFQRIYDEVKYLCKVATAGSQEARQLEKVKKAFDKVYREGAKVKTDAKDKSGTKFSMSQVDGIDYVRTEKNTFTKEDGTLMSEREVFNSLVGKPIPFPDGDIEIVKRLPKMDMYKELYRRYPKNLGGIKDVKQLNSDVNYNMKELLSNSKLKKANTPDVNNRHAKQGVVDFDSRTVKFYDGEKAYTIDFSIANLQDGKKVAYAKRFYGYDAELTKKIQTAESRSKKSPFNQRSVSNDILPQNSEKSSAKLSLSADDVNAAKQKQFAIIQETNPAYSDSFTWIRKVEDIHTLEETLSLSDWADYDEFDPDLTKADILKAIESGKITVYSSHPIENGAFVTPSLMEAESYAGDGEVYQNTVDINNVAWIDPTQGQYAEVNVEPKFSLSTEQQEYFKDSVVRDENGNLKVMYHGTAKGGFNVFDTYNETIRICKSAEKPCSKLTFKKRKGTQVSYQYLHSNMAVGYKKDISCFFAYEFELSHNR